MTASNLVPVLLFLFVSGSVAGDFENGDFSKGKKDWKINNKRISITEDDQKSLQIILDEEDEIVFRQKFKVDRKTKKVVITYKTKAGKDYKPAGEDAGFKLWFLEDNNTRWFNTAHKPEPGVWTSQKSVHDVHDEVREVEIEIKVQPGQGKLYFDDFKIALEVED